MTGKNDVPEQNSDEDSSDDPIKAKGSAGTVPNELRNWRVMDDDKGAVIDGEASLVAEPAAEETLPENPIKPHDDSVIVATLATDRIAVNPGARAHFAVTVLNNGERPARFEIRTEGWIDEEWVSVRQNHTHVLPGARATWQIDINPPRRDESSAGEHHIAFVVRSPDYAEHWCRLSATLQINPFDDLGIGEMQPRRPETAWGRRWATTVVPITNRGNRSAVASIYGEDAAGKLHLDFRIGHQTPAARQRITLELEAGQTVYLATRVQTRRRYLFGMRNHWLPFQIRAALDGKAQVPEIATGQLICRPLIGPWQMATLASILLAVVVLSVSLLAGAFMLARLNARPALPPENEVVVPPAVALVIEMAEPVPTRSSPEKSSQESGSAPIVVGIGRDLTDKAATESGVVTAADPDPSIPVVRPEQVTAPGTPPVARSTAAPTARPQTYAQMFQEIGLRFDLDWRILAGQAYVESGFDSLALGRDGDLGLMQVLPATWKEWAPSVDAVDPFDTYSNVVVAAVYLDYLRTRLGQKGYIDPKWMLVAYNWGPNKLERFLDEGKNWNDLAEARRQYATEILRIAESIPQN